MLDTATKNACYQPDPTTIPPVDKPAGRKRGSGAPAGDDNARKHGGRGRVILRQCPPGYGHQYRVREILVPVSGLPQPSTGGTP
jgi:hypothetical protein